ncbi:ABC transporter permease [Vagococcus sp. BWB3-3]|uniref:ABC transporter permease n=1 Tax=Vagococcus allomyrinae TaxID=2794353 RepID=A0A940PD77_9ENTE|nr:ABC transporter permease [Vagococcus allomyrinae]MBP1040628.1 ABC transporter permease [Vagococcus allomyrinae]
MRAIFQLNRHRYRQRVSQLLLIFILTAASIGTAFYVGNQPTVLGRLAVVGEIALPDHSPFRFTAVAEAPTKTELMMGKFDGYLSVTSTGDVQIVTPKKQELAKELSQWLTGKSQLEEEQPIMPKVIGFMMMFLLMGSLQLTALVGEDKEQHQLQRLLVSPMTLGRYLVTQCLSSFLLLYLTTMCLFLLICTVFQQELGTSIATYSWLIALICGLGVSFGTFMMSLFNTSDTANMMASASLVLTTILSGSFGTVGDQHSWFTTFSRLFPQKSILALATASQGEFSLYVTHLSHVILCISLFLLVGAFVLGRQLKT